jgi:hypothetical protein
MRILSYIFILVLIFLLRYSLYCQAPLPQIIPPAPNAAALGKYGEIPVGLYTGIPSIDIPFYTVSSGEISLPISISYHAGGHKVEDISSNIGLGWSLNCGGVITRSVRGLKDDESGIGYFDVFPSDPNSLSKSELIASALNNLDTQPDIYTYNFGGHSGKLIFDIDGNCHPLPHEKFKIKPGIGPNNQGTKSWEITDVAGTKFIFEEFEETTSRSYCTTGSGITGDKQQISISSWYLTQISSVNGKDKIYFNYSNETIKHDFKSSETVTNSDINGSSMSFCQSELITKGKNIKEVVFPGGKIVINPNLSLPIPADYIRQDLEGGPNFRVKEMALFNSDNEVIKTFLLTHSYFNAGCSEANCKRLKLDQITEVGANSIQNPPFIFQYNSTELPARNSYDQDHWGYFNNQGNSQLVPNSIEYNSATNSAVYREGADKRPNLTAAQACILRKITYPTGGSTSFTYSLNEVISEELPYNTDPSPKIYRIQGNSQNPNNQVNFNIQGYTYPGLIVKIKSKITGDAGPRAGPVELPQAAARLKSGAFWLRAKSDQGLPIIRLTCLRRSPRGTCGDLPMRW